MTDALVTSFYTCQNSAKYPSIELGGWSIEDASIQDDTMVRKIITKDSSWAVYLQIAKFNDQFIYNDVNSYWNNQERRFLVEPSLKYLHIPVADFIVFQAAFAT